MSSLKEEQERFYKQDYELSDLAILQAMKKIYSAFGDRLYSISEKNKCIFLGTLPKKDFFDLNKNKDILSFLAGEKDFLHVSDKIVPEEKYYIGRYYLVYNKGKTNVKAPILFYPVVGEEEGIVRACGTPKLNRALFLALEGSKRRKKLFETVEKTPEKVLPEKILCIMEECGYKFIEPPRNKTIAFEKIPASTKKITIKNAVVVGKYVLLTPLQEDYVTLYNNNLINTPLQQLISGKEKQKKRQKGKNYFTENTDYSQENAVKSADSNIVIYGPPGTGKSQTIAAIVGNEIANGKRVLVVSQKKVALEVIFSRMKWLKYSVLFLSENAEKEKLYKLIRSAHEDKLSVGSYDEKELEKTELQLRNAEKEIVKNDENLYKIREFGLSFQQMYELSYPENNDVTSEKAYKDMVAYGLSGMNYEKLRSDVEMIMKSKLIEHFSDYRKIIIDDPLASHVKETDITVLLEVKKLFSEPVPPFAFEKYDYSRYALPYSLYENNNITGIADGIVFSENKILSFIRSIPLLSFFSRIVLFKKRKKTVEKLQIFFAEWKKYAAYFTPVEKFLDRDGYAMVLCGVSAGASFAEKIARTVDNYLSIRSLKKLFSDVPEEVKNILLFCNKHSDSTPEGMRKVLSKLLPMRIRLEAIKQEETAQKELLSAQQYNDLKSTIIKLRMQRVALARIFVREKSKEPYREYFLSRREKAKNFLFAINNDTRSIKELYSVFGEYMHRLFPCVLVSPDEVSLFPLKKDLFDMVIFDEASQLFAESTFPAVFRAKKLIVAGDDKQLPPSVGFVKRITETTDEERIRDVMEAGSLLDLAIAKLRPIHLEYHYRSEHPQLIDFSNEFFYGKKLRVSPDAFPASNPPITFIKVNGKKTDGINRREADEVVKIISKIDPDNTIGVITFNIEQAHEIQSKIDEKTKKNNNFLQNRDCFVKSIENVQGEERDVIVFSVGYAPDKNGKIYARYGALGQQGGEKRLNVAVTRAKKHIFVVTSLSPNELPIENVKNEGPKLLKQYLIYTEKVSNNENVTLPTFGDEEPTQTETDIANRLEEIGYTVHRSVGTTGYRMSMAIFDEEQQRYLVGIEYDMRSAIAGGEALERDVLKPAFLEAKGWDIIRICSRDWWLSPSNVLSEICSRAEKNRKSANAYSFRLPAFLRALPNRNIGQDVAPEIGK